MCGPKMRSLGINYRERMSLTWRIKLIMSLFLSILTNYCKTSTQLCNGNVATEKITWYPAKHLPSNSFETRTPEIPVLPEIYFYCLSTIVFIFISYRDLKRWELACLPLDLVSLASGCQGDTRYCTVLQGQMEWQRARSSGHDWSRTLASIRFC